MGFAIAGLCFLALPLSVACWLAVRLRREGSPMYPAFKVVWRAPIFYVGILMLAPAVGGPLGNVMLSAVFVVYVVRLATRLPRLVRSVPSAVRDIGDPQAWRGGR
jgi:hypothetical protein